MSAVEKLTELQERVAKAKGPDRELGDAIMSALISVDDPDAGRFYGIGRDFTASVDAALMLMERTLPVPNTWVTGSPSSSGWKINFYRGMTPTGQPHASWEAAIRLHAAETVWFNAPTLPLAILRALLSALIARESSHAG